MTAIGVPPRGYVCESWLCLVCNEMFEAEHPAHPDRYRHWWPLASVRRDIAERRAAPVAARPAPDTCGGRWWNAALEDLLHGGRAYHLCARKPGHRGKHRCAACGATATRRQEVPR